MGAEAEGEEGVSCRRVGYTFNRAELNCPHTGWIVGARLDELESGARETRVFIRRCIGDLDLLQLAASQQTITDVSWS